MRKKKDEKKASNQISVRITDAGKWEELNRLKTEKGYKSLNALIVDIIDAGLERMEYPDSQRPSEDFDEEKTDREVDKDSALFYKTISNLMQEIVLNVVICKSLLCSLFSSKALESSGSGIDARAFESGVYADTPKYLKRFEELMTSKMSKGKK